MGRQVRLVYAALTGPWDRLESQVVLANLGHQAFLELRERRETWEDLATKAALVFRDPEESLANLEFQESQEKWDPPARMEAMERRVDQDLLVLLGHQAFLDLEVRLG